MGGDHKGAPQERDRHFACMRRKPVSKPCRSHDAAKTGQHENENDSAAMLTEANPDRHRAEKSHKQGQTAVDGLFRWKQMREDSPE